MMTMQQIARLLTLFVCLGPAMAAGELYKYVNEDGVTVLDSHVPARYVKNGYTILSLDGRVLEVVPRALTEEEIRERDRRLAEEERREREARERKLADQNLLRLYSTPEDVIRARDSKLASIESYLETTQTNLERLNEMKRSLEAELADIERAGGTIGQARLDRIASVEKRIEQTEREIEEKREEMEATRSAFAADLKRVRELYSARKSASNP